MGRGQLHVVFRLEMSGSTEADLYWDRPQPRGPIFKKVYANLTDLVRVPENHGGPQEWKDGWAWQLDVKDVRDLLSARPGDHSSLPWVVESAKTGRGFFNCTLPLGVAAWLMGLGAKIRVNESKGIERRSFGTDPAWIAIEEWHQEALALVSDMNDEAKLQ